MGWRDRIVENCRWLQREADKGPLPYIPPEDRDPGEHVQMVKPSGGLLGRDDVHIFLQAGEQVFSLNNPPRLFQDGKIVWVNSRYYGRYLAQVRSAALLGRHWRYEVSDQGLHVSYPRTRPERRQNVDQRDLEPYAPVLAVDPARKGSYGLWGFTSSASSLDALKAYAEDHGKDWRSPALQTAFMARQFGSEGGMMFLPTNDQQVGLDPAHEFQLEPLHREFLLTIDHVEKVIGDRTFAEKMRDDLVSLWHEDKVAKGLTIHEALGMTPDQYSAWVEKKPLPKKIYMQRPDGGGIRMTDSFVADIIIDADGWVIKDKAGLRDGPRKPTRAERLQAVIPSPDKGPEFNRKER